MASSTLKHRSTLPGKFTVADLPFLSYRRSLPITMQAVYELVGELSSNSKLNKSLSAACHKKAMSMVLLEGASLGIPVVCSDIEENMEVLGETGIYFKSENA